MTKKMLLTDWLEKLEQMRPDRIELGLSRIARVAALAGIDNPDFKVVTVAGTNGKGSTVAYLADLLSGQHLSVGVYTSPHFIDFNERIVVDGERVSADELCAAFEQIDHARGDIALTYFEFTTLTAIHCFKHRNVDVAVLEVGLGGRLDAVNAWDSQVACVTSVGIDHVDWLGDDREQIGFEKASIARSDCALVCGDMNPPHSIASTANARGAKLFQVGDQFTYKSSHNRWQYVDAEVNLALPTPAIEGSWAIGNASVAICAARQLLGYHINEADIAATLRRVIVAGRMQALALDGVPLILDVAHNADAARLLAEYLGASTCSGKTTAVFSCMQDKDIDTILHVMQPVIDHWCVAELEAPRAIAVSQLEASLSRAGADSVDVFATVTTAFERAVAQSDHAGRIVVFGSFLVVGPVLARIAESD